MEGFDPNGCTADDVFDCDTGDCTTGTCGIDTLVVGVGNAG
jgi:hypothetical protein